jgi:FkbM family methyltransferase
MGIKHRYNSVKNKLLYGFEKEGKKSYSQFGEDVIIEIIFYLIHKSDIRYLDIGANFPKHFSNTYYFYKRGYTGVCIEPDKELYNYYKKVRPKDTVYNIGIGINDEDEVKQFYFYKNERKGLNTFSADRLEHNVIAGNEMPQVADVTLRNINKIISENFSGAPDFLSIDIEGMDMAVLQSLDYTKYQPLVICCEITKVDGDDVITENTELKNFLLSKGYFHYASTFINGIFVKKEVESKIRSIKNWY